MAASAAGTATTSDGLAIRPEVGSNVYCFTTVEVRWPGFHCGENDYVQFSGDSQRGTVWEWCAASSLQQLFSFFTRSRGDQGSLKFDVGMPGWYEAVLFKDGGWFHKGKQVASIKFQVLSSFKSLSLPRNPRPGERYPVEWELHAAPRPRQPFQLLFESYSGEYLQSVMVTSARGIAQFVYPRADGHFNVVLRGNGDRGSKLGSVAVSVTLPPELRSQVHALDGDARSRTLVCLPGARVTLEVGQPLWAPGDQVTVLPLRPDDCAASPGRVVPSQKLEGTVSARAPDSRRGWQRLQLAMPTTPGAYSVSVLCSYRDGGLFLVQGGGASCDVFVSRFAGKPHGASTPRAIPIAEPVPAAALAPPDECASSNPQCIVCMSSDVCCVTIPCNHASMCRECSASVKSKTGVCPVCRERIQRFNPIFFP